MYGLLKTKCIFSFISLQIPYYLSEKTNYLFQKYYTSNLLFISVHKYISLPASLKPQPAEGKNGSGHFI